MEFTSNTRSLDLLDQNIVRYSIECFGKCEVKCCKILQILLIVQFVYSIEEENQLNLADPRFRNISFTSLGV